MDLEKLYSMLEKRRRELGLSQVEVGRLAFGKETDTAFQNIRRGASPSIDRLEALGGVLGIEVYVGLPRVEEGPSWSQMTEFSKETLPHYGYAKCSIQGWFEGYDDLKPLPRPSWIEDDSAYWVGALGQSMQPEGIRPGDYCLISPARLPRIGDRVFVRDTMGRATVKRLVDMDARTAKLRGWQPIRDSEQAEFFEERPLKAIRSMHPVVAVYRGKPGREGSDAEYVPDPRGLELPRHDQMVLVEVLLDSLAAGRSASAPSTIGFHRKWMQAVALLPQNAALVGVLDEGMEPTFTLKSIALINRALTKIDANQVYAIRVEKAVLLRRLEHLSGGTIIMRCDNSKFQSEVFVPERAGDIEVLGKVIWSGHHS